MPYTVQPKERYAKAFGRNMRISGKNAVLICRVIRNKKLKVAKKLLEDLTAKRRDLDGKYYTTTVAGILNLLKSCEKNADFQNLDRERLFVHASAHQGSIMRRRRRKSAFGSRMKMANVEIFLVERGTRAKTPEKEEKKAKEKQPEPAKEKKTVSHAASQEVAHEKK